MRGGVSAFPALLAPRWRSSSASRHEAFLHFTFNKQSKHRQQGARATVL
jgi:hypothetical protein